METNPRFSRIAALLLAVFSWTNGFGQTQNLFKNTNCDCATAITIPLDTSAVRQITHSSFTTGIQEIKPRDKFHFEKEHLATWFIIEPSVTMELALKIRPSH